MGIIKQKECFQEIDSIINKIELLEDKTNLRSNSDISHRLLHIQNEIEKIVLHIDYVEKNIEIYSYTDENYIKATS